MGGTHHTYAKKQRAQGADCALLSRSGTWLHVLYTGTENIWRAGRDTRVDAGVQMTKRRPLTHAQACTTLAGDSALPWPNRSAHASTHLLASGMVG